MLKKVLKFYLCYPSKRLLIILDLMMDKADIDMDDISEKLVGNDCAQKEKENIDFYITSCKIVYIFLCLRGFYIISVD